MTRSTPSPLSLFRERGSRLAAFRFSPFEISLGILAALALMLSPQAALAQHGGGGGHAGGGGHFGGGHVGGGHFGGGGGGHFSGGGRLAGFGTRGYSNPGSHVSPIHVFSGPRSAPAAASARAANSAAVNGAGRGAAVDLRSSDISVLPSSGSSRGLGMFAEPGRSGEANLDARRAMPMHTTIGFPPSTDPHFMSISSARGREPLSFSGQGSQMWRNSPGAAANRSSVRVIQTRPPQRVFPTPQHVFPTPPHIIRGPFLGGAPFLFGSPGFMFFNPGFGFFDNGFGCDPSFMTSFGCGGLSPFGFSGFGYLGFGGGYAGDFGDAGYGYDGGYSAPPSFDVAPPNFDEGASQEPAPSEWQNPPAENSSPDNSGVDNSAPAPETVIFLKDGTSFAVKDYWVADGELHYVTSYGGENAVDLSQFDLERTTDENAQQGIAITLRPAPESQPAAQPQPPTQ